MIPDYLKGIYKADNDIWGLPQSYLGLTIHPILITDKRTEQLFHRYICVPKRYIQDADILRMSYLKFLTLVVSVSIGIAIEKVFDEICELLSSVTKVPKEEISVDIKTKESAMSFRDVYIQVKLGDTIIDESDFDILREILLIQNGLSLRFIEDYDPVLEEKLLVKAGQDKTEDEDRILVFASLLGKTIDEVKNYTLYQFKHHYQRIVAIEDFRMYKPLEISSGAASKGSKIKGYYSMEKQQGRYDSILLDKDKFVQDSGLFSDSSVRTINK